MVLPRFYHPASLALHHNIKLSESAARHAGTVLRLHAGDELVLFNGDGFDYTAQLIEVTRKNVIATIKAQTQNHTESPLHLHLVQAVAKPDKMDWVMQKAVELGVREITPVITKFCTLKVTDKKISHWEGIIISACEQSGRSIIPRINAVVTLEKFLKENNIQHGFIFHPEATQLMSSIKNINQQCHIMVGPEGGFHDSEVKLAEKHGFHSVQIGRRILRTETAALAALSLMQYIQGDF